MPIYNCRFLFSAYTHYSLFNLVCLVILAIWEVVYLRFVDKGRLTTFSNVLLLFGALGNVISRQYVTPGCVLDNLNFFGLFKFNVADAAVSTGVVGLIYSLYFKKDGKN